MNDRFKMTFVTAIIRTSSSHDQDLYITLLFLHSVGTTIDGTKLVQCVCLTFRREARFPICIGQLTSEPNGETQSYLLDALAASVHSLNIVRVGTRQFGIVVPADISSIRYIRTR